MKYFSKLLVGLFLFLSGFSVNAQQAKQPYFPSNPPFQVENNVWVDSVMKTLTPDERIAQLIMVAAYSNRNKAHEDSILYLVTQQKIGGLIFFQGGPVRQARLTNLYQSQAKVPLMISIDGEWGLAMRLDSTTRFPFQMPLGAIQDNRLIYDMGAEIGRQCQRMGIHVNFAPVVDINNNPKNPVINFRSFGENKYNVTSKSIAYMKGMQHNKVLANAKHFPGHGDTDSDSHYSLPVINHDRRRLDSLELYPFREMISEGLGSMMVAHLSIPKLDSTKNQASTLSKPIVTGLLKNELGFKGLIFTDALNMKGVASYYAPGIVDVKALLAGNDVLLFSENVPVAISEIKKAIQRGQISQQEIDQRCRKVLAAKQWAGLDNYKPIALENLIEDLNTPAADLLNRQLVEASLTLLKNQDDVLPIKNLHTQKIASLAFGTDKLSLFQQMQSNYAKVDHFYLDAKSSPELIKQTLDKLKEYDLLLVGLHQLSNAASRNFGLTPQYLDVIKEVAGTGKAIITVFGNPYSIAKMEGVDKALGLIVAYQDNKNTNNLAAQLVFGGIGAHGKLPVSVNEKFRFGDGLNFQGGLRFKYTTPEEVYLDSHVLSRIDSLAMQAIHEKATPGCQVLVAKDGKVIYQKAFGTHTYEENKYVKNTDIYDLASVTKVAASVPAIMKLHDEGKLDLDAPLVNYLPELKKSNKENLTLRQVLAHQARLQAWIPFWKNTLRKNGKFKWRTFKTKPSKRFPVQVANNLYLHRKYRKKLFKAIIESPLNKKEGYVYSDLSFYLYPEVVEKITGRPFETYLKQEIYQPLGAHTLTFNAGKQYPLDRIVPTEFDSLFRGELLHGRVHDEGAAMLSGLSGHAGLFGTANDLAKLMQLYLQKGAYGGERIISDTTVTKFSRCQFCETGNRRGLGFDRPNVPYVENGNTARGATPFSFGHSGFTGTFAWVDPVYNLVYVFLSNRVYPTRNNNKLGKLNTRTNIQQVIYNAIQQSQIQVIAK